MLVTCPMQMATSPGEPLLKLPAPDIDACTDLLQAAAAWQLVK